MEQDTKLKFQNDLFKKIKRFSPLVYKEIMETVDEINTFNSQSPKSFKDIESAKEYLIDYLLVKATSPNYIHLTKELTEVLLNILDNFTNEFRVSVHKELLNRLAITVNPLSKSLLRDLSDSIHDKYLKSL